jgi:hypothetical protein
LEKDDSPIDSTDGGVQIDSSEQNNSINRICESCSNDNLSINTDAKQEFLNTSTFLGMQSGFIHDSAKHLFSIYFNLDRISVRISFTFASEKLSE